MRQKSVPAKAPAEQVVKDIRRATRRHFSAEDTICIVLEGLRGEDSIAELCRREGIVQNLYYRWSKDFLEAGKTCVSTTRREQHRAPGRAESMASARQDARPARSTLRGTAKKWNPNDRTPGHPANVG